MPPSLVLSVRWFGLVLVVQIAPNRHRKVFGRNRPISLLISSKFSVHADEGLRHLLLWWGPIPLPFRSVSIPTHPVPWICSPANGMSDSLAQSSTDTLHFAFQVISASPNIVRPEANGA